jgi:CheY-like chemotaxis protein/predicted regulator of Ras-like GTPase activity (Roadblock/LC7/MglB family)
MTRVLIVDDDPQQLRLLARVIATRKPGLSVVTANSGETAIEQLRAMPVDLVLTDLQMPDVNGFGLVTWLHSHQPHVQVFTMTAYPDDDAVERLRALGSVECYTKPLDVAVVLERLSITLEQGMRGHVRNISLTSLLQLIEMERKTCTLTVHSEGRTGTLFLRKGELLDARLDELCGAEAAMAILGFEHPGITIEAACLVITRNIDHSLRYLMMEAMRVSDELERPAPAPTTEIPPPARPLSRGVLGVMVVDVSSGTVIAGQSRSDVESVEVAAAAAALVRHERSLLRMAGGDDLREMVINTRSRTELIRTLGDGSELLAVLLFDPEETNLVMARLELEQFLGERAAR